MQNIYFRWAVRLTLTSSIALMASAAVSPLPAAGAHAPAAITMAAAIGVLAALLSPVSSACLHRPAWSLLWSLLAGTSCVLASVLLYRQAPGPSALLGLQTALFVLVLDATRQLAGQRMHAATADFALVAGVVAALAVPVWLGTVAEHLAGQRWVVDTIANVSPIGHLAGALEHDFLRNNWFYPHSRIGGLRFEMVSFPLVLAGYLFAAVTLQAATTLLPIHAVPQHALPPHPLPPRMRTPTP